MLTRCWREVDSNHRSRRRGTAVPTPTSVSRLGDNAREGPNPLPSSGESTPSGISPCHGEKEHDQAEGRSSMVAGFGAVTLVAAQTGEARRGPQFPELGPLLPGAAQGREIMFLGFVSMALPQQQLAFVPVQFRCEPSLPGIFDNMQGIVQ